MNKEVLYQKIETKRRTKQILELKDSINQMMNELESLRNKDHLEERISDHDKNLEMTHVEVK